MPREIAEIESEIRGLGMLEKERLLRALLEELETAPDADAERAWLEECQRRSRELDAGVVSPIALEEVLRSVRAALDCR